MIWISTDYFVSSFGAQNTQIRTDTFEFQCLCEKMEVCRFKKKFFCLFSSSYCSASWAFCLRSTPVHVWWVVQLYNILVISLYVLIFSPIFMIYYKTKTYKTILHLIHEMSHIPRHQNSIFSLEGENIGSVYFFKTLWHSCSNLNWYQSPSCLHCWDTNHQCKSIRYTF